MVETIHPSYSSEVELDIAEACDTVKESFSLVGTSDWAFSSSS